MQTIDYLEASDFIYDDIKKQKFTIMYSTVKPTGYSGNWLQAPEGIGLLQLRQTFLDRKNEIPADAIIKREESNFRPSLCTAKMVDDALSSCGKLVAGAPFMFYTWAVGFKKHCNQLPPFNQHRSDSVGGDPNIRYYHSYWKLSADEALLIEATPPKCKHWNFQLNNFWMESLDYRYFDIHVNKHSAKYTGLSHQNIVRRQSSK